MNVLITGSTGFVGKNISSFLHNNHFNIYSLDITPNNSNLFKNSFSWKNFDSLKSHKFDIIIHLAGKAHDLKNTSSIESYFKINYGLTKQIFDFFLNSESKKFIFFSSIKAAVDKADYELSEDIVPNPGSPYGKSKLKAEKYIIEKISNDKCALILRPCMIHGPGNKGNLNTLTSFIRWFKIWPLSNFNNKRSFCSIDNLCFILNKLILNESLKTNILNISDDEPILINDLVKIIANSLNLELKVYKFPKKFIRIIARIGDFLYLPLNTHKLDKLTESYVVSNKKIKSILKIKSLPLKSKDGIAKTLKSL